MFEARRIFSKPALKLDEQLNLLTSRGLNIGNKEEAKHYLEFIGYYRLSAYCLPFQNGDASDLHHHFKAGTTFDAVLDLYIFDRKLRLLVMDAIERIEVAVKAAISNTLSEEYGSHWFMSAENFKANYCGILGTIAQELEKRKKEVFIEHYFQTYESPNFPPSWMVFEILSFGSVSIIFKSLSLEAKKKIASRFNLDESVMQSWLHVISYLRNLCAHHCRLWNRIFTIKPKIAKSYKDYLSENEKFYAQAVILEVFLKAIAKDSHWSSKLEALMREYSSIPTKAMGFPDNWYTLAFWQTDTVSVG
ncbi:Abi family protein [Chroococcidiopsis sp.]|uniref:Abi family protein n=1 Tax=Chroococcidiopsis sp. TaxID=3088168 RepID=UPI003F3C2ADA